jgi:hypothetical protein
MFTYTAHVIDTANRMHSVKVQADSHRTVKAQARRVAKAQGVAVRYVESFFIAA